MLIKAGDTFLYDDGLGMERAAIVKALAQPFRPIADPIIMTVSTEPTRYDIPDGFFGEGGPAEGSTSYWLVNPNNFWVFMRASKGIYVEADESNLIAPNFVGAFGTSYPDYISIMAAEYSDLPIGSGTFRITYGEGM